MKTALLTLTIIGCYAVSSEMSYQDELLAQKLKRNRYETCISTSSQWVITDSQVEEMIALCSARTGYISNDTP